MIDVLPAIEDFGISQVEVQKLRDYFTTYKGRVFSGLALVASPDEKLRSDIMYALVHSYTEGYIEQGTGEGGLCTIEKKPSYKLPESVFGTGKQYIVEPPTYVDTLKIAVRMATDFVLIDDATNLDVAQYVVRCVGSGMRIIAGVNALDNATAAKVFDAVLGDSPPVPYTIDLIIVATDASHLSVSVVNGVFNALP